MRYHNSIEIYVNIDLLNESQIQYLKEIENIDFELNAKNNEHTLWMHDDGHFQITRETLQVLLSLLFALKGVYNNRTKQDHLDLFIEAEEIDEFGIDTGEIKYKNIRASELQTVDLSQVKLKRELYNLPLS